MTPTSLHLTPSRRSDAHCPGLSILDQAIRSTLGGGLGDGVEFFAESIHAA
jgi:hypothetical protein